MNCGGAVREGADGDGKKVDLRCPNAANMFHAYIERCIAKMAKVSRSSEGGKSPMSLFSRQSRRSCSSFEDGSVKSGSIKKVDCAAKMEEMDRQKTDKKSSSHKKYDTA
uniref:Uncharacterized protein n=1 Tax=Oryza brachyantha TaxID=4533 RepID=J3KTY7_ORYBR